MIEVTNVHKKFDKELVLNDVSFQVKKGSIYGLLGSNGAGKTTLMRIVAGIVKQASGEVRVQQEAIFENVEIKGRMQFLSDSLYFLPQYTTRQMANYYRSLFPRWNEERYAKLKDVFQLDEHQKISHFSKGMQRQVAFWLSLSTMPDLLILDEPFDGLDAVIRKKVKHFIIQDVADRDMTVLISSHNLREVEDMCDHIGILHKGTILLEKEMDELKDDVHKIQVAFKEETNLHDALDIVYEEKRGSVQLLIVRGAQEDVERIITSYQPIIYDRLTLTLDEIFIYEMGGVGYDIQNVLV
ncbi:ABC transporter ATP-binding protein [Pontibacillus salicampi]|uniref:ABC transporter ATP-binding protein n=1 Tax=Pontibacillus salicampi TaxID=1449801 RepID=A0ABV6LSG3_9BACI